MKKNYVNPEMRIYQVQRTNVIATSGEAQSQSATEEYETKNVNSIWF